MSTRCQIKVVENGKEVMLYHHCDGYYEGVGAELRSVLKQMDVSDGGDEFFNLLFKNYKGYEIAFWKYADIEYFYLLDFDKKIFQGFETKPCFDKRGEYDAWDDEEDALTAEWGLPLLKEEGSVNILDIE